MSLIASTLSGKGIMPCLGILNPRYSSSFLAKTYFSALTSNPFYFSLLSTLSNLSMWSSKDLLLIIKRSSMYVLTSRPLNNSFIFSWNISGLLNSPMGSFWYSYLPQGSNIVQILLRKGIIWYDNIPCLNQMM